MSDQNPQGKSKKGSGNPNDFYKYTGMAIKMAVVIALGVFGGQKLDEITSVKTPWFTLALSLVSVGMAIYIVISDTSK